MALKEPTHQQLIEALDCAMDQWRKFGDEIIEVLKQHPYLSAYLKPLVEKYSESCAEMREKIDSWPDVPSREKPPWTGLTENWIRLLSYSRRKAAKRCLFFSRDILGIL